MRTAIVIILSAVLLLLGGCNYAENPVVEPVSVTSAVQPWPTETSAIALITPSPTPTSSPAPTPTPTPASTPTPTPTPEPTPTPTPDPWAGHFSAKETVITVGDDYWCCKGPTLGVVIRKKYYEDCTSLFFIAHIWSRDPSNLIAGLYDESKGRLVTYPETLARKYQAVYGQNANYFFDSWNEDLGPDIRNGIVYKKKLGPDTMAFDNEGNLVVFKRGRDEYSVDAFLAMGLQNTFSFGPIIVENGTIAEGISKHSLFRKNPRSAFGMVETGHYVGIVVDGRKPGRSTGVTLERLGEAFIAEGCITAYNLDGGQSTAMVFMGDQLNDHLNETTAGQRRIPDMLIFGTSPLAKSNESSD